MEKSFKKFKTNETWTDYGVEKTTFDENKKELKYKIEEILKIYDNFTKTVSPKYWRTTGHHFIELNKMKDDIDSFSEITEKQLKQAKKHDLL